LTPDTVRELPSSVRADGDVPRAVGAGRRRHPLLWFISKRLGLGLATLLIASALIFLATNALPGNVAQTVLGRNATPALVAKLTQKLHLDRSLVARYGSWLGNLAQGDLGQSAVAVVESNPDTSISSRIDPPLRNSLVLAIVAFALLVPLSLLLGTFSAVHAGGKGDYAVSYPALVFGALPEFVLATLLVAIFFSALNLLPPVALVAPGTSPLADVKQLVLPVVTLLGVTLAFCVRQVRAGVLATLRQEYVTMARLAGLRERRVLWRYALRNALAPSVQTFAQALQYLFGGIIVVETFFDYPGIGRELVQAVLIRDVTEVQAIAVILAAVFIAINVLADVIVVLLVPKLRTDPQ
jgi:peptide/nickel transport system permease protein